MSNDLIPPRQFAKMMLAEADRLVSTMPLDSVRRLAEADGPVGLGVNAAIYVCIVMAARKRLLQEESGA